jgi:hypothetical protein
VNSILSIPGVDVKHLCDVLLAAKEDVNVLLASENVNRFFTISLVFFRS